MYLSPKIWWLLPAICVLLGALAAFALQAGVCISWPLAIKEGAIMATVLGFSGALIMVLLCTYPTRVGIVAYAVIAGILIGIAGAWMHAVIAEWVFTPAERGQLQTFRDILCNDRWLAYPLLSVLFSVSTGLFRRMNEMEARYALQQDASALLKEAELFKLRQQLQPHFLYNSLNAIASLVIVAPAQASEMITRLSDFLRSSVKQGKSELVPLEEELDFLRNYLWIETVRFGDRLQVEWSVAAEAMLARMPPFLLQPLMENAIRFGIYGRSGEVTIAISITLEAGILKIRITNPFDATMKAAGGTGFGLTGVRRRLYLMFARQDLLLTSENGGQFSTTILIPQ